MRSNHLTNRRLIHASKVLKKLSLSSKVSSSNRTNNTRSCNVFTRNLHEVGNPQIIVNHTEDVFMIHVASTCFQHSIQQTFQKLNLKRSDFLLEDTTTSILKLLYL